MALSVSVPLVIYMAIGALMRELHILTREQFSALNNLIFRLFLPVLLFTNVYGADLRGIFHPVLFSFVFLSTIGLVCLFFVLSRLIASDVKNRATIAQGCYRSNYLFFGTLMAQALCGESGMALLMTLSALVVPLYNIVAVVLFEVTGGGKPDPVHLVRSIFKNPIVDAGILAIVLSFTGITVPQMILSPFKSIGSCTTPLALITLGGVLSFQSMKNDVRMIAFTACARLVVIPLAAVLFAVTVLGFRGDEMVCVLAVFASPTAVASAAMAKGLGGNENLAAEIVATTSVACVATIFLFVYVLSSLGII